MIGAFTGILGSILGIASFWRDHKRRKKDEEEERSQFHLDASIRGYEAARNLLADGNNDRSVWIQAGRALRHAQALGKGVTTDQHRRLLELHRINYRGFFQHALEQPSAFFYGAEGVSISLEDAAKESTAPARQLDRTISSTVRELSPRSLHAVWEAAKWPKDYEDPLDTEFSDADLGVLFVLFPGLHEFLEHRKRWRSASGKLFPVKNDE